MRSSSLAAALTALAVLAAAAPALADGRDPLNAYRVSANANNLERLALAGFDVTEGRRSNGRIEIFATSSQVRKLRSASSMRVRIVRDRKGRTSAQRSVRAARRAQTRQVDDDPLTGSDAAYKVWRRYDAVPGDGKEQFLELYDRLDARSIVKKVDTGVTTHLGRRIIAVKVTKDAKDPILAEDGSRPAVLYNAIQHSREWLAGETCRRTLLYFTNNYGIDERVTRLVDTRELWFMCISNPDGYEYSFTPGNRLWRKNMADNNKNEVYGENGDGVDPNRNFPASWGLDNEGSSPTPSSETYRGPEPYEPEPETQAMLNLFDIGNFEFQKNDHTAASLLLYPQGWQQYTPTADDPIFTALAGTDKTSAINGFDPDLGAELYITNGDTLDTAYNDEGILAYTPEGTPAKDQTVSGFEYEDSEGAIQAEFQRHRNFSIDLAESAANPAQPVSHLKNTAADFQVDTFAESFGDPQPVQVLAKRSLGAVTLNYRIGGGAVQTASTQEWSDGERYYQDAGEYYHRLRGTVTGTAFGDSVEVWFTAAGNKRSKSFTYKAANETSNRVLVMAAEDYTGPTPTYQNTSGPKYASAYLAAVPAALGADLYDVDARGRRAPHPLGVLSHYDAVIWYTGDDYLTREPGQIPGSGISRLAIEEMIAARDYINEGGKLIYAGKHAGQQYAEAFEFRNFGFPQPNEDRVRGAWCDPDLDESRDGCISAVDDFLQYHLGAYLRVENGGSWQAEDRVFDITGDNPLANGPWTFAPTLGNTNAGAPTATFGVTSSMIDRPTFADSRRLAGWVRPGGAGPFSPHEGAYYMAASHDDEAYKRLHTDVDLTGASSGGLKFWTSYDLEPAWDFMFVEVRGEDGKWTTLRDANGHTTTETGDSCWEDAGWGAELHARLLNYQTVTGEESCSPIGTTGVWNAATGGSDGWQEWSIDLSAYADQEIEVAIVVATDWAIGNLGAWVDEARITVGGTQVSSTSFEADTGVWSVGPAPEGTPNPADWQRSQQQFVEGAVVGTTDTVYAGFEIATMKSPEERASFLGAALQHLGVTAGG